VGLGLTPCAKKLILRGIWAGSQSPLKTDDPKFLLTCCLNSGNVKFLSVNVLPMSWCTPEMLTAQLNLENSESFSTY